MMRFLQFYSRLQLLPGSSSRKCRSHVAWFIFSYKIPIIFIPATSSLNSATTSESKTLEEKSVLSDDLGDDGFEDKIEYEHNKHNGHAANVDKSYLQVKQVTKLRLSGSVPCSPLNLIVEVTSSESLIWLMVLVTSRELIIPCKLFSWFS